MKTRQKRPPLRQLGVDLEEARVIHVTEARAKQHYKAFNILENKGVDKEQVKQISMDLSPSFIAVPESFRLHRLPLTGSMSLNY